MRLGAFTLLTNRLRANRQRFARTRGLVRTDGLRDESGFTLIEVTIATGVIMTSLALLAAVLASGLTATAIGRERQSANGLANETLELVRALPYPTLTRGLDATDLANTAGGADPNITTTGCGGGAYCFRGERIVYANNAPINPLVPHTKTVQSNDSTDKEFSVSTYLTYYKNQQTAGAYRVTVNVAWTSAVRNGSKQRVQTQSIIFPNGCLSLPEHPYSGPCQSAYTAAATADAPTTTTSGRVGGVDVKKATLYGGTAASDATIEQTSRVAGLTTSSSAVLDTASTGEQNVEPVTAASQADNDPSATKGIYETKDLPSQSANSTNVTSSTGSIAATVTGGGIGRTTSTTSASTTTTPPLACPNLVGVTNENDSLPCGASTSTTGTTTTLNTSLNVSPLVASSFPVAVVGPQTGPTTTITDRAVTTGVDKVRATVTRSATGLAAGGLPNIVGIKPVGFDYFVKLNAHADSVSAESGVGSTAPTNTTEGTLSFWTSGLLGTGSYTTVGLDAVPAIPSVTITDPLTSTEVTLSATVTRGSRTTTSVADPTSCTTTCVRTSASAKATPIKVTVTEVIKVAGQTVLDLTTVIDPGAISARTSYVPAPTA